MPAYVAFFGRDTLLAASQAALLTEQMMRGTLAHFVRTQAAEQNDWLDAQPGRFVHQIDTGPLATLRYDPLFCYYGTLTAPGLYPLVLSNLWYWSGDRGFVQSLPGPALKGLAWLDRYAKRGDGFYAYQTRALLDGR